MGLFILFFVVTMFSVMATFCRSFLGFLLLLELSVITIVTYGWMEVESFFPMGLSVLVYGVGGASMGLSLLLVLIGVS